MFLFTLLFNLYSPKLAYKNFTNWKLLSSGMWCCYEDRGSKQILLKHGYLWSNHDIKSKITRIFVFTIIRKPNVMYLYICCITPLFTVKYMWVSCHHHVACPQVMDGRQSPAIEGSCKYIEYADMGSSKLGVGNGANNPLLGSVT